MEALFPATAAYIARLPQGLDSHPECLSKASLYRSTLEGRPFPRAAAQALPPELRQLVLHPLPVTAWVPEVRSLALAMAHLDACCSSLDDFERSCYLRQRRLFDGPLYRVAVKLATPSLLLRTAARRWTTLHRGTTLVVKTNEPGRADLSMEHPPHLWDEPTRLALTSGLRALLDLCGARNGTIDVDEASATHMKLIGTWS
ncbi:MAG: hypothetical protein KUG77_20065 [Nannocystaceae bacterium]|nr:hypothetical protein [Nannocystaceae bacterium]